MSILMNLARFKETSIFPQPRNHSFSPPKRYSKPNNTLPANPLSQTNPQSALKQSKNHLSPAFTTNWNTIKSNSSRQGHHRHLPLHRPLLNHTINNPTIPFNPIHTLHHLFMPSTISPITPFPVTLLSPSALPQSLAYPILYTNASAIESAGIMSPPRSIRVAEE